MLILIDRYEVLACWMGGKPMSDYQRGDWVRFTTNIEEGIYIYALKGQKGVLAERYGHTGVEWVVRVEGGGPMLRVRTNQFVHIAENY